MSKHRARALQRQGGLSDGHDVRYQVTTAVVRHDTTRPQSLRGPVSVPRAPITFTPEPPPLQHHSDAIISPSPLKASLQPTLPYTRHHRIVDIRQACLFPEHFHEYVARDVLLPVVPEPSAPDMPVLGVLPAREDLPDLGIAGRWMSTDVGDEKDWETKVGLRATKEKKRYTKRRRITTYLSKSC